MFDLLQQMPPDFSHVADAMADLVSQYQLTLRRLSRNLEEQVEKRTAELKKSKEKWLN